jgi:hypothetical protein
MYITSWGICNESAFNVHDAKPLAPFFLENTINMIIASQAGCPTVAASVARGIY